MDVRVLRAAWTAQAQGRAASRRRGLAALLAVAALPAAASLALLGHAWSRALPQAGPGPTGLALAALLGGLALLSGTWDGTLTLRPEAFRPFQVAPSTLFLAELAVGAATPVKAFLGAALGAFALGAAWGRPVLLPWLALALPLLLLALLALERLAGLLARRFGRTFKSMALFGICLAGMRAFLGWLLAGGNLRGTPTGQHLAALPLRAALLPTTWLASGLRTAALRGWPGAGLAAFIAAWAALLGLTYLLLRPDLRGERPASAAPRPRTPRPFRRPWVGAARLHLGRLWSSKPGRFMLFLPIFALASLIDPLVFGFRPGSTWILAWSGLMLVPVGRKAASNLFGLDRAGVRTFWLLPLEDRDLLAGKAAATALFQALIAGLMVLALALAAPLRPLELLGAALLFAALALFHLGTGLLRSLEAPAPLDPEGLNPAGLDDPTLVTLGRLLLPWLLLVALWFLALRLGTAWAVLAMGGAVLAAAARLRGRFERAVRLLEACREPLTLALEGEGQPG